MSGIDGSQIVSMALTAMAVLGSAMSMPDKIQCVALLILTLLGIVE